MPTAKMRPVENFVSTTALTAIPINNVLETTGVGRLAIQTVIAIAQNESAIDMSALFETPNAKRPRRGARKVPMKASVSPRPSRRRITQSEEHKMNAPITCGAIPTD
jgi:hypothetical protein